MKEKFKISEKKAVSAIVETILLVLIATAAVSLIASFVIPMIKKNLQESSTCFQLRDYLKIVESSCYKENSTELMIERGMEDIEIKGFAVSLHKEKESKRYDIPGSEGVEMLADNKTNNLEMPKPGEARTYVFNTKADKVTLAAITSLNVCGQGTYNIQECKEK